MLLLPLLLFWVRTPMYFSKRLRRCAVSAIFTVSLSAPLANVALAEDNHADVKQVVRADAVHLREGTEVADVSGRFALVGRRWAFFPDRRPNDTNVVSSDTTTEITTSTQLTFIDARTARKQTISSTSTFGKKHSDTDTLGNQAASINDLPQLMVVENLMLQRIAKSILLDPADDRWTISGEVLEFFDENGLLLRTAKRASLNE